jgi:hypothetical protein
MWFKTGIFKDCRIIYGKTDKREGQGCKLVDGIVHQFPVTASIIPQNVFSKPHQAKF